MSGGRSARAQCQNPEGIGASGSNIVTEMLLVPSGTGPQDSCGETSRPPGTSKIAEPCSGATAPQLRIPVEATVKDGTCSEVSYGDGTHTTPVQLHRRLLMDRATFNPTERRRLP